LVGLVGQAGSGKVGASVTMGKLTRSGLFLWGGAGSFWRIKKIFSQFA